MIRQAAFIHAHLQACSVEVPGILCWPSCPAMPRDGLASSTSYGRTRVGGERPEVLLVKGSPSAETANKTGFPFLFG